MFWQPTATLEALHAAVTVGSSTGDGNRASSSRVWPATRGKKASTNALASAGVLYIFQLAAISFLRDILYGILRVILSDPSGRTGDWQHSGSNGPELVLKHAVRESLAMRMLADGCGRPGVYVPPPISCREVPCFQWPADRLRCKILSAIELAAESSQQRTYGYIV